MAMPVAGRAQLLGTKGKTGPTPDSDTPLLIGWQGGPRGRANLAKLHARPARQAQRGIPMAWASRRSRLTVSAGTSTSP